MDRAISEAQLKDRKIVKYLMRMLDMIEAIDRLINANIARLHKYVLMTENGRGLKRAVEWEDGHRKKWSSKRTK